MGAITPLLALPAISLRLGPDGWTAIAMAQAIGGFGLVVGELGWGIVGPQRVAAGTDSSRLRILRQSFASQLGPTLLLAVPSAVIAGVIAPQFAVESAVIALGTVLQALNPTWYFIGLGRPYMALWTVSVPRLILVAAAAVLVLFDLGLVPYAIAIALMSPLSVLITFLVCGTGSIPRTRDFKDSRFVLKSQWILILGRSVSAAYTSMPAAIVGSVRPEVTALFAANDRIARMGLSVLTGVPSRFQNWIGSAVGTLHDRRVKSSIYLNLLLGLVAGIGFITLSPLACSILFAGTLTLDPELRIFGGCLVLCICFSRGLGLALVAGGRANAISYSIFPAAILAILTIGPFTNRWGAEGATASIVAAELLAILVQLGFLFRRSAG